MSLAFVMMLASWLPQPVADPLCLATTVYLEARNQSDLGQRAVAEVALRRLESGRWGQTMCEVVTAPKQFAPTLVSADFKIVNLKAWERAVQVAYRSQRVWKLPSNRRPLIVPGADHFLVHHKVEIAPEWATGTPVAQIGDHTFYRSKRL